MAGNDGSCTGTQAVDVRNDRGAVAFQHIADGLRGEHITAAGIDVNRDFFDSTQSRKVLRELFRSCRIVPPAPFCNVAIEKQFRFLVITRQVTELPERFIFHFG